MHRFLLSTGKWELGLTMAVMAIAVIQSNWVLRRAGPVEDSVSRVLDTVWKQLAAVAVLAVALRVAILSWVPAPVPMIHDEQSLLLQARTYLLGRWTNPTPPFWQHFESFHINLTPTYGSIYFPGRGLPLFIGLWLTGQPWLGVWASVVLMCVAAVWMLRGWVTPRLALLGGLLVVVHFAVFSYWINSLWGGAFTAFGAFLVVGALPRLLKAPDWKAGLALAVGILVLMTTRPYEGMVVCLPVAAMLLLSLRRHPARRRSLSLALIPGALAMVIGLGILGDYNLASTGNALTTPYGENRQRYASAPAFLFEAPIASAAAGPRYFRNFYNWEFNFYRTQRSPRGFIGDVISTFEIGVFFFTGWALLLPFAVGCWASRRDGFVLGSLALFYVGLFVETWKIPHYAAPIYPLVLLVVIRGLAAMAAWPGRAPRAIAKALPAAAILSLGLPAVVTATGQRLPQDTMRFCCALGTASARQEVLQRLALAPGRHLVLVEDDLHNPLHTEMVYNDPDIEDARVIWAHSLGADEDAPLVRHFADRHIWVFQWTVPPYQYRLTRRN